MKSKKTVFTWLLATIAILSLFILSACGSGQDQGSSNNDSDTVADTPEDTSSSEAGEEEEQYPDSSVDENAKQTIIDFTMTDENGDDVTLLSMVGKPIVMNFWASWCPPCKEEMPGFDVAYQEFGDEITFVMVDMVDGYQETVEKGKAFVAEHGFTLPIFFDTNQEGMFAYGVFTLPSTLFIDKDGYIIEGVQGAITEETLRKGIDMIR